METNEAASRPGKPALLSCSQCPVLQFWAAAKPGTARHPLPPVPAEPALAPPAQGVGCERSLGIAALVRELGKRLSLGERRPRGAPLALHSSLAGGDSQVGSGSALNRREGERAPF